MKALPSAHLEFVGHLGHFARRCTTVLAVLAVLEVLRLSLVGGIALSEVANKLARLSRDGAAGRCSGIQIFVEC